MPVSFKDILLAFEFVSSGGTGEHQAFLCKQSGTLYWHSEFTGDLDELPDDIDDSDKYAQIPDKKELDLGKPLVLDLARQFLPDNVGDVQEIFSKRGAYARFKIQGSVAAKGCTRSVVRFRSECGRKSVADVVRSQFDRGR
ncbi:hypothetical protein [Mesorhizobium sp. M0243]|uniref:hypothetical protein n=1 Tax=Mesorhizobium sp. M0243 TaxID=2956925 RepID=UPI00333E15E2